MKIPSPPPDIVEVIFSDGDRRAVRGDTPMARLAHLHDAVIQYLRERAAFELGLPRDSVVVMDLMKGAELLKRLEESLEEQKKEGAITIRLVLDADKRLREEGTPKKEIANKIAAEVGRSATRVRQILKEAKAKMPK